MIVPIHAAPSLGAIFPDGSAPVPRVFLGLKGVDRQGRDVESVFSFEPLAVLRLASHLIAMATVAVETPEEIVKNTEPSGGMQAATSPSTLHTGQYL